MQHLEIINRWIYYYHMKFIRLIYSVFLEALFPTSNAEGALYSYTPEQALIQLPKSSSPSLENSHSIFAYKDERVTRLVWQIKYMKSAKAIAIGGYALHQYLLNFSKKIDNKSNRLLIVPIPITPKRRRERGYNQTELIINEILKLDQNNFLETSYHLLARIHHDSRQTLKGRADRLESTHNIFAVNEDVAKNFKDRPIVVIDDVITTGSTMKSAIETLKNAGLERVYGVSLAH